MTNEQLIQERWKYTDNQLKLTERKFQDIFKDIRDELIELFKELNLKRDDLNKVISSSFKRTYERKKREWKQNNIITPYFQFLINTTTKLTYSNVLKIFVFAIYMKYQKQEFDECKSLLVKVANNIYKQAKEDLNLKQKKEYKEDLLWKNIRNWAIIQTINVPLEEYLGILNQEASDEASRTIIQAIKQEVILDESMLSKMIEKQKHRLISVNGEKDSGMLENASRTVGNKAYYMSFPNHVVRFVAEVDNHTTKMCLSLDNQLFNTKEWNIFYRYSDFYKDQHKFSCKGLEVGLNLPPISDHFHWCRSTITYNINYNGVEYLAEYNQMKSLIDEYLPDNFEEYAEKVLKDDNYHSRMKNLESLKKHFNKRFLMNNGKFQDKSTRKKLEAITFDDYQLGYFNLRDSLYGLKTSDDIVINDISFHFYDRTLERNIDLDEIKNALVNNDTRQYNSDIINYRYNYVNIGVSKDGNITTGIKKEK